MDCPTIRPSWQEEDIWNIIDKKASTVNSFHELSFSYLKENHEQLRESFLMLPWSIWYRWNNILWNDGPRDPFLGYSTSKLISSGLEGFQKPFTISVCPTAWTPPRSGFIKAMFGKLADKLAGG